MAKTLLLLFLKGILAGLAIGLGGFLFILFSFLVPGEGGKIFGSVSGKEVAEAVKSQLGIDIDKKKILLSSPIKGVGTTEVPVKLHSKVTAQLKVTVEAI